MSDFGIRASDGISVKNLTERIIKKYDSNKDNEIDVKTESTVKTSFSEDSLTSTKYSMGSLFIDADANKDGKVNKKELYEFIETFDTNKDGDIDSAPLIKKLMGKKGEDDKFQAQYGEKSITIDLK